MQSEKRKECVKCGKKISKARLKVLPGTDTCVRCSGAEKKIGVLDAGDLVVLETKDLVHFDSCFTGL